jgi:hypothetical protein
MTFRSHVSEPRRPGLGAAAALVLVALASRAPAQVAADYAVQVTAAVQASPARIVLSWGSYSGATQYVVSRKAWTATSWGSSIATLSGSATGYTDSAVTAGTSYEYQVLRQASVTGYGYVASGIALPLVEDRGTVVLVVDSTYAADLTDELARLQQDLVGDGWSVIRHDVARNASVPSVKALIKTDYLASPSRVKTVFLFGHVPVPYSGDIAPDGHGDHIGAWPADLYYGDMDGTWTDTANYGGTGRQNNVPGDGKFDQSSAPGTVELAVGRVDLANMPAFGPKTERDLLLQYLDKDHAFRHAEWTLPARGLIDDNFGAFGGEAFASTGWRAFSAFFGRSDVFALDWFTTLAGNGYLWAYGCGGGNYTGAGGVGSTSNFATTDTKVAFTFLFGSYFGDWDASNDFLRAPLATKTYGLTCAWAGRPAWYVHHMAMGETIGYGARVTQNNSGTYFYGYGPSVHIALMGDPTLRLTPVAPVSNLAVTPGNHTAALSWTASPEVVDGYHVYRSPTALGTYARVTPTPVMGTSFTDAGVPGGSWTYMVRAVRLETSASGSYGNASQGVFATTTVGGSATSRFFPVTPCRLVDTRRPAGPLGGPALAASATRLFVASGACGVPAGAQAIAANVTVTNATVDGRLVVYPADLTAAPQVETIVFRAGSTRANNGLLVLARDASGSFKAQNATAGSLDLVVDVTGYFP